jgi:hypothetical protein
MSVPDLRSVAPRHGAGSVASVLPAAVAAVRGDRQASSPYRQACGVSSS